MTLGGELLARTGSMSSEDEVPAAITDIGCEREINEDRYAVVDCSVGRVWIVCDGMGGCVGGELAAQLAIDSIRRALDSKEFESGSQALRFAIEEANRSIVLRRQNPSFSTMGTTTVAALVQDDEIVIAHAGDSRAYLVRDGQVQQLTVDDTYVQDLVERGVITASEALSHPQAHVLTKCLGAEPRLEVAVDNFYLWENSGEAENDKLVLCSDGLYSLVSDEEIAQTISTLSPQESCVRLVEMARSRGGFDNITLAVLPLTGRLNEERSEENRVHRASRLASARTLYRIRPQLTPEKRLLMIFLVGLFGAVFASALVLMKLLS